MTVNLISAIVAAASCIPLFLFVALLGDHGHGSTTRSTFLGAGSLRRKLQSCEPLPTGDFFQIINRQTNLALHVDGMSTTSGANVVEEYLAAGTHDNWRLIPSGFANYYHIIAEHSGMALAGKFFRFVLLEVTH